MMKKISPIILILPLFVLVTYISSYFFLRDYQYADTKNSTFGTIGVSSFTYFDRKYTNAYPVTINDAIMLAASPPLFMPRYKMQPLILYIPLERLELLIRGTSVLKLTKQEELDLLKEEEMVKSMNELPY